MNKQMAAAKKFCEKNQYRFTDSRQRILAVLLKNKQPMGAYDVLKALSTKEQKVNPPSVYRAIDFWVAHGFVHKIESVNSFVACREVCRHQNLFFFVCQKCQQAVEVSLGSLSSLLLLEVEKKGMSITKSTTELYGCCSGCAVEG